MSGYDDDALDLCCYQRVEQSIENRPISDLDEAFGGAIGQRPKASADAGSKNDGGRGHRVEYCPLSRRAPGGNLTSRRRFALVVCASLVVIGMIASPVPAAAQRLANATGAIDGSVSVASGDVRLPGATVSLQDDRGVEIAQVLTEADGRFRMADLTDGRYRLVVSLAGFQTQETSVLLTGGRAPTVAIELPIATAEHVDVVASPNVGSHDTLGTVDTIGSKETEQFAPAGGLQAALRLLASVIQVPGGLSIKGGRPNQSSTQLGESTLIDPSTGLVTLTLPPDAIDSVEVLPNPYTVEFGRFSSGLVVIRTRRAGDRWQMRLNNLDPGFRTERHNDFKIVGVRAFAPRFEIGGPLIAHKLFLEQTAQYRYDATEVASRPQSEARHDRWLSAFTRLDGNLTPRHAFVATGGLSPSRADQATLGTFVPPDATVNLHQRATHAAATERASWSNALFSESSIRVQDYRTDVEPRGREAMELRPETTLGNFFNRETRASTTYQWITTVSATRPAPGGLHLFKVGVDLLGSAFDGSSISRPFVIAASDGAIVRRIDFNGPSLQQVRSTDLALFAQDRFAPNPRLNIELGGRVDRDGVLNRINVTPRVGTAVVLDDSGDAVLHGGYGLFYERTPSLVGAFSQFETMRDTRVDAEGMPIAAPATYVNVAAPDLRTSRSTAWNLAYDHRLNASWSVHGGLLDRRGADELIVNPVASQFAAKLLLQSDGRSVYREAEAGVNYTHSTTVDFHATYVRSSAQGDLNSFTSFFGTVRSPIIGVNAYAPLGSDIPHRLLVRGRVSPTSQWLLVGVADWHTGLPYSRVNRAFEFAGARNADRFPDALRVELGIDRRLRLFKWRPWIGVRADNALNAFLPADVQANVSSPAFGTFYNSDIRQLRLKVRFER